MNVDIATIHESPTSPVVPETTRWESPDPRFVTMRRRAGTAWSLTASAFWLLALIGFAMLTPLPSKYRLPIFAFWGVIAIAHLAWSLYRPKLLYRHSSFRLDEDGIEIRTGLFFRSIISVPRSRVQHTDVSQGPFERRYGLGTLLIYTAGVSHAQVPLAGLAHERATEIRDALLPRERVRTG